MASAVLANRNEPNWTQPQPRGGGAKFMGKIPFSNPNPNSKFSKKRQFQPPQPPAILDIDESPSAASDDASSINRRPLQNNHHHQDFNTGGYVSFNVGSYSKKQLIELKNRLVYELEKIRDLKSRIESADFQIRPGAANKKSNPVNKKMSGSKRPFPATSNFSNLKRGLNPENAQLLKNCGQILTKLMKHKLAYIFNTPVDVVGLGLHDYYDLVKNPMDLGTVKSKLGKNLYDSPRDFAADVRLTFNNAMRYNPKGHEVHHYAEQLLSRFEELYRPTKEKVGEDVDEEENDHVQEVQASSWDHNRREPERVSKIDDDFVQAATKADPIGHSMPPQQQQQLPVASNQNPNLVRTPSPMRVPPVKSLKQPKPKAKDPNKRDMSLEEKHKLGVGLQSLPQEKMEQVVQIIRKRNGHLRQEGDEIELDIEAVDTETLWELDRFVTNYKKMVSKIKRQALMGVNNNAVTSAGSEGNKDVPVNDKMEVVNEAKKPKKGDAGDEDVDIGDEMPMSSFPPVEIEKDNGHASSSSSSSSSSSDDSSSSSDSDSGSSSGSDSEGAHS